VSRRLPRVRKAARRTLSAAKKARHFRRKHLKIAKFPGRLMFRQHQHRMHPWPDRPGYLFCMDCPYMES
jgi:hypothetical protein